MSGSCWNSEINIIIGEETNVIEVPAKHLLKELLLIYVCQYHLDLGLISLSLTIKMMIIIIIIIIIIVNTI